MDNVWETASRLIAWLDETEADDYMDTGIVLEYAQEIRQALLEADETDPREDPRQDSPRRLRQVSRFTVRHLLTTTRCTVPETCAAYRNRLNRFVQYDENTGDGIIYYADELGRPTTKGPVLFSGLGSLLSYLRAWLECCELVTGWPEGFEGLPNHAAPTP